MSCLVSLPLSNVASPRSPAGLPSLTVGARPSDLVFPIQPPRHEITKTMPSHEVSGELASWHFLFFFLSLSLGNGHCDTFQQVEQCWTRDETASALLLSLQSDGEKEDEAFESEKSSPACTCVPATVVPLHVILMFVFCFFVFLPPSYFFSMCDREFQRENGFSELSPAHACTAASQVSSLWRRLDLVRHKSQVLCMNLQY